MANVREDMNGFNLAKDKTHAPTMAVLSEKGRAAVLRHQRGLCQLHLFLDENFSPIKLR